MSKIIGKAASQGISNAKAFILKAEKIEIKDFKITDIEAELSKLNKSLDLTKNQIETLRDNAEKKLGKEKAEIFDAHLLILQDPELTSQIESKIREGFNSTYSIDTVSKFFINMFSSMDDEYMKERASDVSDVTARLLKNNEGIEIMDLSSISEHTIIVAYDLTPSETSQLNPEFVKGFITEIGGKTSHSAIMARSMEIPAVVGIGSQIEQINNGTDLLMDGNSGEIILNPDKETINKFKIKAEKEAKLIELEKTYIGKQTITNDGWNTNVAANIGSTEDIDSVLSVKAEGVGLFRTEFLYMKSSDWPTEEEQFNAYKKVLENIDHKVVIRTLDIGGDKKLDFYEFPHEENPFLGYRAIRFQIDNEKATRDQFRALLRASAFGKLAINVPMIATIDEFIRVKETFIKYEKELVSQGIKVGKYELGIMVEVPSTVMLADKFAKVSDFFSIGTNDLIQYTFAADRMSQNVSYLYQPLNPSILRMINQVIKASHVEGKWTAVCGELGSEPLAAPLLVGMGLDEFSMSATSTLRIKRIISSVSKKDCEALLEKVLNMSKESEVIEAVQDFLKLNEIEL